MEKQHTLSRGSVETNMRIVDNQYRRSVIGDWAAPLLKSPANIFIEFDAVAMPIHRKATTKKSLDAEIIWSGS